MNETILGGAADLALGAAVLPAEQLGDIVPSLEEGTITANTQRGARSKPSGRYDEPTLTFTYLATSMDDFKNIWADIYNAPSGGYEFGNLVFGAGSCSGRTPVVANIHYICDEDSRNDQHYFSVIPKMNWNGTLSASGDPFEVEVTLLIQPTDQGLLQIGSGSTSEAVLWDAATQTWEPIGS